MYYNRVFAYLHIRIYDRILSGFERCRHAINPSIFFISENHRENIMIGNILKETIVYRILD